MRKHVATGAGRYRSNLAVGAGIALAIAVSSFDSSRAQEAGNARNGFDLAQKICSVCHAVRPAETSSPMASAPSFERIASVSGMTATALKVALRTSHKTMPNLILSEDELNDVIAHILSLGDR
jgi:mono/diheme cytochrome c family protein